MNITFLLDCTVILPTAQLGDSSGRYDCTQVLFRLHDFKIRRPICHFTLILPTVQRGNSSGTLWLHTCTPECTTEIRRRIIIFDCTTRETRRALYHCTLVLRTVRLGIGALWFPDCTTRKFVGRLMVPHLLSRHYDSGKLAGVLWLHTCSSDHTTRKLVG